MNTNYLRIGLIVISLGMVGALVYLGGTTYRGVTKGEVTILVAPTTSTIRVDNETKKSGVVHLAPGKHIIVASKSGFTDDKHSVDVEAGKQQSVVLLPKPTSDEAKAYLAAHPDEQYEREGLGSEKIAQAGSAAQQYQVIASQLPYDGTSFILSYGDPLLSKGDQTGKIALYVRANDTYGRTKALTWIRQQGLDPTNIEIIFNGVVNPFTSGGTD